LNKLKLPQEVGKVQSSTQVSEGCALGTGDGAFVRQYCECTDVLAQAFNVLRLKPYRSRTMLTKRRRAIQNLASSLTGSMKSF